ncbi:SEN34 subunit of tRNA-splicing endonuclease [Parathielavia appendiculata]|uniref:tRNA-splicing endonuclease subunit Sen34 n=1 Tax=Parathielavia appendiculata TaxID=2587402 RepID=A0AAN6U4D5_9PEZI|nr:SEN34 subunit of tRNA-splicing endonuclease [Parathielavia appendiculata]
MATAVERRVRISRVAGRYLVFDIDDVLYIRRHHCICAVLTGTMPQNPTQNLFLSLPVELQAEEAQLLVDTGAGYIADELTDHMSRLSTTMDECTRKAYLQHIKQQRRNAQRVFEEEKAKVQAMHQNKRKANKPSSSTPSTEPAPAAVTEEDNLLFDNPKPTLPPSTTIPKEKEFSLPGVTPTTSYPLLPISTTPPAAPASSASTDAATLSSYPLYKYLNSRGYYTTPGLRFGGDYSVYPGDPFRYHAHYLANSYRWDEEVAMLDLVTSGRLGTAVKKSFLFGAEKPGGQQSGVDGAGEVRVFCIEWAGM